MQQCTNSMVKTVTVMFVHYQVGIIYMKTDYKKKIPGRIAVPAVICCGIVLIIIIIMYKTIYYTNTSKKFLSTALVSSPAEIGLTAKEKEEDFLYLYKQMKNNVPAASIEIEGSSFIDNKDAFLSAAVNTESDYEFYCMMYSLMAYIPSCHTNFFSKFDLETIQNSSYCYNSSKALSSKGLTERISYWNIQNTDMMNKVDTSARIQFKYVEGKYIFSDLYSKAEDEYTGYRLVSVNGISADEYAAAVIAPSALMYDGMNEKWFRPTLGFNTVYGDAVILELEFPGEKNVKIEAFYDNVYENSYIDKMISLELDNDTSQPCYSLYISNDTAYITVNSFMDQSLLSLYGELNNAEKINEIIVDLRDNSGGFIEYAAQYLYPILYANNAERNNTLYIKRSADLNRLNNMNDLIRLWNSDLKILNNIGCDGLYYVKNDKFKYEAAASEQRNIYFLIGRNTCSAADGFAADMKKADNTIIVGNNSGGEGMIDGYVMDVLPNSGLLFIYNPSYSLNGDGTNNSAYGTSPDIYSDLSAEGFLTYESLIKNGDDPYTYENRLKWDSVLIKTLEMIEEGKSE